MDIQAKIEKTDADKYLEKLNERFGEKKIAEWKKHYNPRQLNVIDVEGKIAILKPVGATEVAEYSVMVANHELGLAKATEYLINECWLDGDDEILNDEEYFIAAMMQTQRMLEVKKSSFLKL